MLSWDSQELDFNIAAIFDFMRQGKQVQDIELTRRLDPATLSLEDFVKANVDGFNAAMD